MEQLRSEPDAKADSDAPQVHGVAAHHAGGRSASYDECKKSGGFTDQVSKAQLGVVRAAMATRAHRLHHALWHNARTAPGDVFLSMAAFGASWSESRALCPPPKAEPNAPDYNPAGEDFLYMHRQMIGAVRGALMAGGQPCVSGWSGIPDPAQWPLPDAAQSGPKSPAMLARLKAWDAKLRDPAWLASVSLSQLGMAIEFTTHNNLHMRYATANPPAGFGGVAEVGGAPIPLDGKFPADWPYDDPAYDWLADPYSAAVNPLFWKLHGYVDNLIDEWLKAKGFQTIAEDCHKAPGCYEWRGKWAGSEPTWSDAPVAAPQPGEREGRRTTAPHDPKTVLFNQQRMRKQWLGVIDGSGEAPRGQPRGGDGESDPFVYAAKRVCGREP